MTTTKTDPIAELFYSGAWHDIVSTDDVLSRDPIAITRGRPDESSRIPPSTLGMSVDNRDGLYSPRNPSSALYGLIGRNTPIRVSLRGYDIIADSFDRVVAAGWGTSEYDGTTWLSAGSGGSVLGSDFRIDSPLTAVHSLTATSAFRFNYIPSPLFGDVTVTAKVRFLDTTDGSDVKGNDMEGGLLMRLQSISNYYHPRVEFNADQSITASLHAIGGTGSLGSATVAGITYTGQWLRVKGQCAGSTIRMRVWEDGTTEPSTWDVSVTNTEYTTSGYVGCRSGRASGNTNATAFVYYQSFTLDPAYRFCGEVESWPQRWNVKGTDVWVPITANGIMRRLNAPGTVHPALSALRRDILDSASPAPVAYYPLEEGKDAPVPLPYGALGSAGVVNFADAYHPGQDGPTGTLSVYGVTPVGASGTAAVKGNSGLTLPVPAHTSTGTEVVTLHARWRPFDNPKVLDGATYADVNHRIEFGSGDIFKCRIQLQASDVFTTGVSVTFWNSTFDLLGTPDTLSSGIEIEDGDWHEIQVRFHQNGSNIDTALWIDGASAATSSIPTATLGTVNAVVLGTAGSYDTGLVVGTLYQGVYEASHVTVHTSNSVGQFYQGMIGHAGENAATRITRLCAQDGIASIVVGVAADSDLIGVQRVAPLLDLLFDAADADDGILYEPRGFLGLAYRTHTSLYNQIATVALDYSAGGEVAPTLLPVEDTDAIGNDITVTRFNGGSARVVQSTGTLNVQERSGAANSDSVGRYAKEFILVLNTDGQCLQQAAWRRHLGTWDEARYPVVNMDLAAMAVAGKTALIAAAASLNVGDRFSIAHPPAWVPPDSIEQHAQGFVETIESHRWFIATNATPALPYGVLRLETDTANLSRIPTAGSTLAGTMTTTSTSRTVSSAGQVWINSAAYAAQFPFDIIVAGERMTVTAITGTTSPQTFTVTRSVNGVVKSHASGESIQLFRPPVIAR